MPPIDDPFCTPTGGGNGSPPDDRTMIIVSLSFCIGVGLTQTSGNFFSAFPQVVGDIFNGNAVAGVFVISLLLSLFLPKKKKKTA